MNYRHGLSAKPRSEQHADYYKFSECDVVLHGQNASNPVNPSFGGG